MTQNDRLVHEHLIFLEFEHQECLYDKAEEY